MPDTHDEWIDLNGPKSDSRDGPMDKDEMQEKARKDKAEGAMMARGHSYSVYRRAGLAPLCALRFMTKHTLENFLGYASHPKGSVQI